MKNNEGTNGARAEWDTHMDTTTTAHITATFQSPVCQFEFLGPI